MSPSFSVILATYNRAYCICNAIDSILKQTYPKFELVIVDDGSTDSTCKLVERKYAEHLKSGKVVLKRIPHGGVCKARNEGLRTAKNEWIAYIDSDNTVSQYFLGVFAREIMAHPDAKNFYAQYQPVHGKKIDWSAHAFSLQKLKDRNFIDLGVYVHHKSLVNELGMFDESMQRLVDWDLVLRHCMKHLPVYIPVNVMSYSNGDEADRITNSVKQTSKWIEYVQRKNAAQLALCSKTQTDCRSNELPAVSVVITTHNRTETACTAIKSLVTNLKYNRLKWILADDRSDAGHVEALVKLFKDLGMSDVSVCRTSNAHFGLGASLNNGLREAFKTSDIVLTTEDDWYLQKELDLYAYVNTIVKNHDIAAIRLAAVCQAKLRKSAYSGYDEVYADGQLRSVFNNQVALRHRRIYDTLGWYKENCSSDDAENDMSNRFNAHSIKMKVLFPSFIKKMTLCDESLFFMHFGDSTVGHQYKCQYKNKAVINNQIMDNQTIQKKIQFNKKNNTINIEYEYKKQSKTNNIIHILLVNFGNTISYTCSLINDLLVQTHDFDLTIIDNGSNNFNANRKYFKFLCDNWNFKNRSLYIYGLKQQNSLNQLWNSFYENTTNKWLCFLNNDLCIPENFILDNINVILKEKNAGIINHTTNNAAYSMSNTLKYRIYNKKSNAFLHRQGWDFTIRRDLYVKIPDEFTTYIGDDIQFNSAYQHNADIVFVYSSPILHYCSTSMKSQQQYYNNLLRKEQTIYKTCKKFKEYGNANKYGVDGSFSKMKPDNIELLKNKIYFNAAKKIIVSLTTWKKRIQNVPKVLTSILNQTLLPNKIVINLAKEEFIDETNIPQFIQKFINDNKIEINWVEKDTKVYKKIIPTLLKYKNELILSIDDDFIYPKTMIQDFYKKYQSNPNQPISGNNVTKYNLNCHCGCASLVQYKFFNLYIENYELYYQNCPSSDIFFTVIANKNGYKYIRTNNLYFNNMTKIQNNDGYSHNIEKRNINLVDITYQWLIKHLV